MHTGGIQCMYDTIGEGESLFSFFLFVYKFFLSFRGCKDR